jgi:hypothetical protein
MRRHWGCSGETCIERRTLALGREVRRVGGGWRRSQLRRRLVRLAGVGALFWLHRKGEV